MHGWAMLYGSAVMKRMPGTDRLAMLLGAMLVFFGLFSPLLAPCETNGPLPSAGGAAGMLPVAIEAQTYDDGTLYANRYRASLNDCSITWIAYNNEPGVVKYQPDCPAPLMEQMPLMSAICASFLANDLNASAFRTLFWGRLAPDSATVSHEMSFRLAAAAFASSDWDKVRGRPTQGNINRFTRDLANQARIYPELEELFSGFHRTVTLRTVEKVLVQKAGQLPFFDQLKNLGVKADDLLPFDGMAWFSITADTAQ
jgi:hypothetical protein